MIKEFLLKIIRAATNKPPPLPKSSIKKNPDDDDAFIAAMREVIEASSESPPEYLKAQEGYRRLSKEQISEINIEIPEKSLFESAVLSGPGSNFARLMTAGEVFRQAGLTPVYFMNRTQTAVRVVPREYIENPNILN